MSTSSASTARLKTSAADRAQKAAGDAGKQAAGMAVKAAKYAKDESVLQSKLATVIRRESEAAERDRQKANRREQARVDRMVNAVEGTMEARFAELREPKKEKLRILFLGATSEGDLRVDREIKRIEAAVKFSTNRDLVEILPKMAATKSDLLDGLTAFSPHVVHFSGHSNEELLTLDQDVDVQNPGALVTADLFAQAMAAVDEPPLLVVLNSCKSARQLDALTKLVIPFAIGMSDSVGDADAITFAARFYSAVADGKSILGAFNVGKTQMELDGLPDYDLPTLANAPDADPGVTKLVVPPG